MKHHPHGCYEKWTGTTKNNSHSWPWDDPKMDVDMRKPMIGVWEIRKKPKS